MNSANIQTASRFPNPQAAPNDDTRDALLSKRWKVGTELFYPHWEVFEWLERGEVTARF